MEEMLALEGSTKPLSADSVAHSILQQAAQGHFMVFPGTDSRLFYLLTTKLPKNLVFAILDLMATPKKKAQKA
jgi:hypothetical protein